MYAWKEVSNQQTLNLTMNNSYLLHSIYSILRVYESLLRVKKLKPFHKCTQPWPAFIVGSRIETHRNTQGAITGAQKCQLSWSCLEQWLDVDEVPEVGMWDSFLRAEIQQDSTRYHCAVYAQCGAELAKERIDHLLNPASKLWSSNHSLATVTRQGRPVKFMIAHMYSTSVVHRAAAWATLGILSFGGLQSWHTLSCWIHLNVLGATAKV